MCGVCGVFTYVVRNDSATFKYKVVVVVLFVVIVADGGVSLYHRSVLREGGGRKEISQQKEYPSFATIFLSLSILCISPYADFFYLTGDIEILHYFLVLFFVGVEDVDLAIAFV